MHDSPAERPSRGLGPWALRALFVAALLVVGILAGLLISRSRSSSPAMPTGAPAPAAPQVTWAAGERPAPDFRLHDEAGAPVSISRFRGRPVIVTFMDPVCRDFCPLESKVLDRVEAQLPADARPAIVAVSVNRWANSRHDLLAAKRKWKVPADWHWAVGAPAALQKVWRDYQIAVQGDSKTHEVVHTEAAFILDRNGDERALFMWPFVGSDVARTVRGLVS